MRICPKCGSSVDEGNVCGFCGYVFVSEEQTSATNAVRASKVPSLNLGIFRLSLWNIALILICDISIVLILVDAVTRGSWWSQYPVLGMIAAYAIALMCFARSAKKFMAIYRYAVLILNTVAGVFYGICCATGRGAIPWAFDYFIPINILIACIVMVVLLFISKPTPVLNVLLSLGLFLIQGIIQMVFMFCGLTAGSIASQIIVSVSFGINALAFINIVFLYFFKYRNAAIEKFRFFK